MVHKQGGNIEDVAVLCILNPGFSKFRKGFTYTASKVAEACTISYCF